GRALTNRGDFPKRIQMATLPPYAGFAQNAGVLPFVAGKPALWPLAVRRTEKAVPVQLMRMGGEDLDIKAAGDALAVRAASSASALALWRSAQDWPQDYEKPLRPYPVSRQQQRDWATTSVQNVATSGGATEFVPLVLNEPGLYLAEANSCVFSERLQAVTLHGMEAKRPQQRASLVMVTNLNITTRIGDKGDSLVWVTALDSGQPVAGASVDVLTCTGRVLAQGNTDKNGLLSISAQLSNLSAAERCVSTQFYGHFGNRATAGVFVVARKGRDLAVLPDNSYGYGNASDSVGHTILDRTLFKAGETVHMQHLVRSRTAKGFSTLPAGTGRLELHFMSDLVATLPLLWDATGQASSQWTVPANAKLGDYRLVVFGPDGSSHQTELSVQEFRVPVFDASLTGQAVWQAGKQNLHVNMSLAFLAGGAAAGQAVSLSGQYVPDVLPPVAGYSFSNLHLPQIQTLPLQAAESRLDGLGKQKLTVVPPQLDRPTTLQAEMKFTDPNGEVQTIAKQFVLWHSDTRLGLRVSSRANPAENTATTVISGVALDAGNTPLARYKTAVFVQAARRSNGSKLDLLGSEQALCTSQTDSEGKAECETDVLPALPEPTAYSNGWLFSIRGVDGAGKPVVSNVFVAAWQLRFEDKGLLSLATKQPTDAAQPIQLAVRAPFLPATLLLTTERESVLDSAVYTLRQPLTTLTMALRPEHAPNVLIRASFVRGLAGSAAVGAHPGQC
ncbi:MAG: MG2 domain-containing protein, partial [Pseudomonadota bacterium]